MGCAHGKVLGDDLGRGARPVIRPSVFAVFAPIGVRLLHSQRLESRATLS